MNDLYTSSTLVKTKDVQEYISELEDNKSIILHNDHNYRFATKLFSLMEIYKILDIKQVEDKHAIDEIPVCLCCGFYDSSTFLNLTPIEEQIYNILTTKFWPGTLHICVRAKTFVDSIVTFKDHYIMLNSSTHRHIRKILETIRMPLVTFLANKKNHLPIISHKDLEYNYLSEHIPSMNQAQSNTVLNGIHNTTIMIENNTITLLRRGPLAFNILQEHLNINYTEHIHFKTDICIYPNISCTKPIYSFQLMDIHSNINDPTIIQELKTHTKQLLERVILIDYHRTLVQYKEAFYGYVDLSETGSIQEYIDNLYPALHTIMQTECKKIYITDIQVKANGAFQYVQDILEDVTNHKKMVIPMVCLQ